MTNCCGTSWRGGTFRNCSNQWHHLAGEREGGLRGLRGRLPAWPYFGASFHHTPQKVENADAAVEVEVVAATATVFVGKSGQVAGSIWLRVWPRGSCGKCFGCGAGSGFGSCRWRSDRRHYQAATSVASQRSACVPRGSLRLCRLFQSLFSHQQLATCNLQSCNKFIIKQTTQLDSTFFLNEFLKYISASFF